MRWNPSIALALAAMIAGGDVFAGTITIRGSDTMVVLTQRWAESYMALHPGTAIQVNGGGTGTGFAALQNRSTDICNASRRIRAREKENCLRAFRKIPAELRVALDGLNIYVNSANSVQHLSLEDLAAIFTGSARNWKQFGGPDAPITVYSRENSSGTYEFFKERVLEGRDFTSVAQTLQGTAQVIEAVSRDAGGIGYGGAGFGEGARHLKIAPTRGAEAVEPTEESVVAGRYPISRFLYCYVNPDLDRAEVADYLQWIRGSEGQRIVRELGYYPLPPALRAD